MEKRTVDVKNDKFSTAWKETCKKHTYTLVNVPIKQQSQASKKQRVKNMIDDLWLLSYSSIFKAQVGFHWLTAVTKYKWFQHHDMNVD